MLPKRVRELIQGFESLVTSSSENPPSRLLPYDPEVETFSEPNSDLFAASIQGRPPVRTESTPAKSPDL